MLQPFPLFPGDTALDFEFDWSAWLQGDAITSFVMTVSDGLVLGSTSRTGTVVTFNLTLVSGVSLGHSMTATCDILTIGGRRDSRDMLFVVKRQTQ